MSPPGLWAWRDEHRWLTLSLGSAWFSPRAPWIITPVLDSFTKGSSNGSGSHRDAAGRLHRGRNGVTSVQGQDTLQRHRQDGRITLATWEFSSPC